MKDQLSSVKLKGIWDENQSWEFCSASELPDAELCTAVYCLAILSYSGEVVLTRNHRGWEMLGGHIEPGETIEEALIRECLEEGGFVPESYKLFGYRKVTAKKPVLHSQREGYYPFPNGYIPHFVAKSSQQPQKPPGAEILESRSFSLAQLQTLKLEQQPLIEAGLAFYRANHKDL